VEYASLKEIQKARNRAAKMFAEGKAVCDVARYLGYARQTVSQWHSAWERFGSDGLKVGTPRPLRQLSENDWQEILEALLEGPRAHGYETELWTLARIADLVEKKKGIRHSKSYVCKQLERLNWSCQKPERRARERNEEEIARWKVECWPLIKRGRKTREQHWSL